MHAAISAVVIARNAERYIADALGSIAASTRPADEVLVIDGHSTDSTADIARRVRGVRVLTQQSTGIADAYNEGVDRSTGSLIAFLSSDDRWDARKLALQEAAMRDNPEVGIVLCMVQHELEPGCAIPPGFRPALLDAPVPGYIMEALMVRRTVFDRVGRFDPDIPVSNDTDWFARARDAGIGTIVLPEVLVTKRVHDRNSSLNEADINQQLLLTLRRKLARRRAVDVASGGH